jgi:hypothetical protein
MSFDRHENKNQRHIDWKYVNPLLQGEEITTKLLWRKNMKERKGKYERKKKVKKKGIEVML